jgi:hypothetical protein
MVSSKLFDKYSMSKKSQGKTQVRYEVISQQEDDDVLIPIPPVLLEKIGWKEGDEIEIAVDANGKYVLKRVEK